MEKVFLIGGSGFIGKNLARILSYDYEVYVFDKFIDQFFFSNYPSIQTFQLDLVTEQLPEMFIQPDFIINLASVVTAERDLSLFDQLITSNLKILLNLYYRFKDHVKLKMFIQFGSSEEYGSKGSPFKEAMRERPNSPYALVKQFTTNTAMMLYENYHFPVMVVRPGNLFGPMQPSAKFIPYVLSQLKNNQDLNVSPCEQKRDFIYVDDFSKAITDLMNNYLKCIGKIINVSCGNSVSLKEIIEICKTAAHSNSSVHYGALPYRENEAMDLRCDTSLFTDISGRIIPLDLDKRLKELI